MISIGRFRLGLASASVIVVFIVLSVCAVVSAFYQVSPENPVPLPDLIVINEGMALLITLIYGIFVHFAIAGINKIRKCTSKNSDDRDNAGQYDGC